jgi:hypothetical protein
MSSQPTFEEWWESKKFSPSEVERYKMPAEVGWHARDAEIKALRETLRTAREAGEQLLRPDGSADVWHSAKREIEKVLGGEK